MLHLSSWIDTTRRTRTSWSLGACLYTDSRHDVGHRRCFRSAPCLHFLTVRFHTCHSNTGSRVRIPLGHEYFSASFPVLVRRDKKERRSDPSYKEIYRL